MMRDATRIQRLFNPSLIEKGKSGDLPDGVCGRTVGVACKYNTPDDYGTMFAHGCFDRTRSEKVGKGKVQLFLDHEHDVHNHVGVVREIPDVGDSLMMYADFFDNEAGRAALDYTKTVLAADAFTGLSVGGFTRNSEMRPDPTQPGKQIYTFTEFELAEISLTPVPAVPGTEVMHARRTPEQQARGLEVALEVILTSLSRKAAVQILRRFGYGELDPTNAAEAVHDAVTTDSAVDAAVAAIATVPMKERVAFLRANLDRLNGSH